MMEIPLMFNKQLSTTEKYLNKFVALWVLKWQSPKSSLILTEQFGVGSKMFFLQ
jgi:hypothetical protein